MITLKEEFVGSAKWNRAIKLGGPAAIQLWIALKRYAAEHLTDGFIPDEEIDTLIGFVKSPRRYIAALVECGSIQPSGARGAGLVDPVQNGWQLHDYLDHANSAEQERARREAARTRQERHRSRSQDGVTNAVSHGVTDGVTNAPVTPLTGGRARAPSPAQPTQTSEVPPKAPQGGPEVDSKVDAKTREKVVKVFEVWRTDTGHEKAILDRKRGKRIQARLQEGFTVDQLTAAIRNRKNDPFLMGKNDTGRVYDELDTLLRDAAQVERLERLTAPLPGPRLVSTGPALSEPTKWTEDTYGWTPAEKAEREARGREASQAVSE